MFHHTEAQPLFAGDHVLPTITPSLGYEPEPGSQPLGDFSASSLWSFNKALATLETRAHLELLVAQGRALSQSDSGRVAYSMASRP